MPKLPPSWRILLVNGSVSVVGLYCFGQEGMRYMLFGVVLMLYGAIGHAVDSLALYIRDVVEVDLNKRIDELTAQLSGQNSK
jgi:hypothetical protein